VNHLQQTMFKRTCELSVFALPLTASMFIQMFTGFFSMLMVARLGENALAAGALAVSTYTTISLVVLIFYAIGILISHKRGQEKELTEMGGIVRNGLWLALLLMLPVGALLWYGDSILALFRQDANLIRLTRSYFHYAAFVMPPTFICMVIMQFFIGMGWPKISLYISVFLFPFMLLLSYALILGKFGLPMLGLAGITAALGILQSIVCVCLLGYLLIAKNIKKYAIFTGSLKPDFSLIKHIFLLGYPIGVQFGAELSAMTIATYLMGHFGVTALAASQIVSQYSMLVVMIILGLSQSVTMLSSAAYGKKEIHLIQQYVWAAIYILSIILSVVVVIFIFFPKPLILFFSGHGSFDNNQLIHLSVIFFAISVVVLYADGIRHIISGGLRGLHDSKGPMRISIIAMWLVSLPVSYLVGFVCHGGPIGLRMGFLSGFIFAAIFLSLRIYKKLHLIKQNKI